MSGIKPQPLTEFYRRLHARGESVASLARKIGAGRAHLTQVLNHTRGQAVSSPVVRLVRVNRTVWERVQPLLTPVEKALLAQVPRGTKFHVKEAA